MGSLDTKRLTVDSPLGKLTLTSAAGALTALDWNLADTYTDKDPVLEEAARQLRQYFAGNRTGFDLPMQPHGTVFQKRVWSAMLEIPCGKTATYGGLARQLEFGAPRDRGCVRAQSAAHRHSLPSRRGWSGEGRLLRLGRIDHQGLAAEP